MVQLIDSPSRAIYCFLPGQILFAIVPLLGLACFFFILAKRVAPLLGAAPDFRFDRVGLRLSTTLKFWLAQWKQPRYLLHLTLNCEHFTQTVCRLH